MAVTNYDTVNGQLIGESTGGVTTTYLADELGSVVQTAQSGAVVNRYRYSPYGILLSKTGTGPDPKFGWVGCPGYRTTTRSYSEKYVRARHYATPLALWTSIDPIFAPFGPDRNAYTYADCTPASRNDPSGLLSCSTFADHYSHCPLKGFDWGVMWQLPKGTPNGYIVQKITREDVSKACKDKDWEWEHWTYFEAWQVVGGTIYNGYLNGVGQCKCDPPSPGNDHWGQAIGGNTCNEFKTNMTGVACFFKDVTIDWPCDQTYSSRCAPFTKVTPSFWVYSAKNCIIRYLEYSMSCCRNCWECKGGANSGYYFHSSCSGG